MKRKTYNSNERMKRKTYNSNERMKRNSHICFHLVLLLLIAGGCMNASAQKHVSGRVVDPLMMPVAGASVALTNNSDSSAVSKCASDSSGRFSIAAKPGLYTMRVSCIGYKGYEAEVNCHDDISIHDIVLTPESREIDGVTVTGKRMTYNSKGYAFNLMNEPLLRDNTLLETLTLLPGLSMKEGNLVAYQQDIVSVFINNKKLRLSMPDILHVLSTYESKNIRTVEVLNSTADPEESSRMGFVLKITTKTADDGGSLSLGFSDQTGNTRENTMEPWFSLQQRTGRWSFYLSPSYTPKSVMKRSEHTTTNYYATGRERKEFSTWTMTSKPKVSGTATIAYDFNANHTLMLTSSGEYDETTHRTATDNSIRENGSTHQTNGVTTRTADKKQASVSLDYNGRMGKLTLISAASYTMRNTIQGNEHLQETGQRLLPVGPRQLQATGVTRQPNRHGLHLDVHASARHHNGHTGRPDDALLHALLAAEESRTAERHAQQVVAERKTHHTGHGILQVSPGNALPHRRHAPAEPVFQTDVRRGRCATLPNQLGQPQGNGKAENGL